MPQGTTEAAVHRCSVCDEPVEDIAENRCGGGSGSGSHHHHTDCVGVCDGCEACLDCCECNVCDGCGDRGVDVCSNCEGCDDCCECNACARCDRRSEDSTCERCERCDGCCECAHCQECSEPCDPDTWCSDCEAGSCCGCTCEHEEEDEDACNCAECRAARGAPARTAPSAPAFFEKRPVVFWEGAASLRVPSTRFAAVEIEVANARADGRSGIAEACRKWSCSIVRDASLPGTGFEVTTSPARGDKLEEMLAELCGALKAAQAEVGPSCGLHVHADARDFGPADVARLVAIYAKVEPALYALVTAGRVTGSYSIPCGADLVERLALVDLGDPEWVARLVSGLHSKYAYADHVVQDWKDRSRRDKYAGRQYGGLNLASFTHRQTFECRIHHGTTDLEKILPWAQIWTAVLDAAKAMTDDQVAALPGRPLPFVEGDARWDRWDKAAFQALQSLCPTADVKAWARRRRRQFMDLSRAAGSWVAAGDGGEF